MLSVRNLRRPGLGPVSFELPAGQCLIVRGASGSGKSLLLRALADLDPNEGQVALNGEAREAMPAPTWRRRVAYLPAEPGWWADTVGAHFTDWTRAAPLVQALGLPEDCHAWPIQRLSTGERQRLGLIRLLLGHPQVLMLDEPTSGLDPDAAAQVERVVRARLEDGTAVIWVTHDAVQAQRLGERVLTVEDGQVEEGGL